MKKAELLKECAKVLGTPKVATWADKNLMGKNQGYTISSLEQGVSKGELTVYEALCIALVVGVQWKEKFEGVP